MHQAASMTLVLQDQSMKSFAHKHHKGIIWLQIQLFLGVWPQLKAKFVHHSKLDKMSEEQKLKLRCNLDLTGSFFPTNKLQNGVIVLCKEHLDAFGFPSKLKMQNNRGTCLKFATNYTIYVHGRLELIRFGQYTWIAGKEMQWTMRFGTTLRTCYSQTSVKTTEYHISPHMQSIINLSWVQ